MTILSFTQFGKAYDVQFLNGKAVSCTCKDHQYRNRECKHMSNAQVQMDNEIARCTTFLALKKQFEDAEQERKARIEREETRQAYVRMFYSEY